MKLSQLALSYGLAGLLMPGIIWRWRSTFPYSLAAEADNARVLQAGVGAAVLLKKETTCDTQEMAIEYSASVLRGERYADSVVPVRKKVDFPKITTVEKSDAPGARNCR